ncbi:SPOR domain-containing protein [Wielerella bovis]|uniref:SPOR domain-containing protein n=1 Tax=Wielerella bovis TaxID=2917790 RepID=UPI0020186048|nr:SPOR domain-containing protein [Wielerella bovis]MCG7656787.1 SPOR domain-containing protein [Wielerella bovis]MCG7659010.1 SPOR domain-containing protein [Wielerella bovis]
MNQPNNDQQYEYEIISEYELLKRKNRRRLIGAGAITLLAGSLFAAVASNEPKEQPQPIVYQQQKPKKIQKEVLQPTDLSKNQASDAATASATNSVQQTTNNHAIKNAQPTADEHTNRKNTTITPKLTTLSSSNALRADEMIAEAPQAENKRSVPETARQLTEIASPAPLTKSTAPKSNIRDDQLRTTDSVAKSAAGSQETAAQARKRRQEERRLAREEAARKKEMEKRERELARQRAEQARIAKAREDERRRREAQAISAKAEAERLARQRATAERARQAQLAAERARQAEREKIQAQQRAANEQQRRLIAARVAEQQRSRAAEEAARKATERKTATASTNKNSSGKVIVQAGAFRERDRALQVQQKLRSLNYSSRIEEINTSKGKMYRVQTGTFANRNEAEQAAAKMKSRGLGGMVIEHK